MIPQLHSSIWWPNLNYLDGCDSTLLLTFEFLSRCKNLITYLSKNLCISLTLINANLSFSIWILTVRKDFHLKMRSVDEVIKLSPKLLQQTVFVFTRPFFYPEGPCSKLTQSTLELVNILKGVHTAPNKIAKLQCAQRIWLHSHSALIGGALLTFLRHLSKPPFQNF